MSVAAELLEIRRCCSKPVTRLELDLEDFGLSLQSLREDAGVLPAEMAACLGISMDDLSAVELGQFRLPLAGQMLYVRKCQNAAARLIAQAALGRDRSALAP